MSQNDILFSRGVSNSSIVASGTKLAVGVIPDPLNATLANADLQIFGSTGMVIPNSNDASTTGLENGTVRFNPDNGRIEVVKSSIWRYISDEQDIGAQQFESVGAGSHYYTDSYVVIEKGGDSGTVSLLSVGLSIQDEEPTIVLRNLSSATGTSSIFMMGGTGNVDPAAVNGYEMQVITDDSTVYGTSLEINPVVQGDLSTVMNSVTLTPYGMEIVPAVISITGSITQDTLKIRGSAHTTAPALMVDKEDWPGVLPASSQDDANKVASFAYTTTPIVDVLASGKLWMNGATGAVLAVKAIADSGYLAKFEQGSYSGTNLEGLKLELSVSSINRALAIFNGKNAGVIVSAARIDSTGNVYIKQDLSLGNNCFVGTSLSLPSIFAGGISVSGTVATNNISISNNLSIGGILSSAQIIAPLASIANIVSPLISAGSLYASNFTITNLTLTNLSLANNISVGSSAFIGGTASISGNVSTGATFYVAGNMITNNNLSAAGRISGFNYPARVFYAVVSRAVGSVTVTTIRNTISDTLATSATAPSGLYVSSIQFTGTTGYGSFSFSTSNTIVMTQTIESTSAGGRCQNVSFNGTDTIDITNVVSSTNGTGAWDYFLTVLYFG